MKKKFFEALFLLVFTLTGQLIIGSESTGSHHALFSKDSINTQKNQPVKNAIANIAPTLTATGDQIYCPGTSMKIVTDMTIVDPDDLGIDAIYIQISSGYDAGQDVLTLTGSHPNITTTWNAIAGTLSLTGVSGQPTYIELVAAIKDVEFSSSAANPTGVKNFSISVGQANYLPSNGHYYLFVPNIGITWSAAKTAAQASNYYGLQGYLATLTSAEESQIAGEQTSGAGWIGGSDEANEGVWKWMTGPEIGTVFWNGDYTGSTPNYAFWNGGEPNNVNGNENYAHITATGVGITGSWNDLSNTGEASGSYQPKGYIAEYGGMPGDPILHISTSTTLTIPTITSTTTDTRCGTGTVTLQATSNTGVVNWYQNPTGGAPLGTGNSFTTPTITGTTTFYIAAHSINCNDDARVPIKAFVTPRPVLTVTSPYYMCDESYTIIDVQTTSGIMFWYDSPTSTTQFFLGTHFIVPNIHQDTIFYAEANYNGCLSTREPVDIKVYAPPVVADEHYDICSGDVLTLNAQNPGLLYQWSTGETTQTITSNGLLSDYSVVVTTLPPGSCSKTMNFHINQHVSPVIAEVAVDESKVTIITTESGDFEYSINGIDYQNSNEFIVSQGGTYTAYVREKNGCGTDSKPFIVITYLQFFTPNGDNFNDVWFVKGEENFPEFEVKIFDRFGKVITILNASNLFWDGTYNGKLLPSTDYWFVAKINGLYPEKKGHFSLKR